MTISDLSTGKYLNEHFCTVSEFSREEAIDKTSIELGWFGAEDQVRLMYELKQQKALYAGKDWCSHPG